MQNLGMTEIEHMLEMMYNFFITPRCAILYVWSKNVVYVSWINLLVFFYVGGEDSIEMLLHSFCVFLRVANIGMSTYAT